MNITYEPGDGTTDIVLELHDPIPIHYASQPSVAIWRRIEGGRIVVVKKRGEQLL